MAQNQRAFRAQKIGRRGGIILHTLICGVTQSGKTTLARELARAAALQGQNVIVFDPVGTDTAGGGWPPSAVVFDDSARFFEYVESPCVIGAHVFIDEAADFFGVGDKDNQWLLTRGRHFYLHIYLIAQRPKMIAPNARTQCGVCYMFRLACEDADEIGRDFGHSQLGKISLDKGDFFILNSGQASKQRANIFNLLGPKP